MSKTQNSIARPIEVITQEINFYKFQAGTSIIEIGKRLCEAKQCLPHGKWGEWLEKEVEFSERTAQNFMRIAKEYTDPQMLADMGNSATKALLLLSLPAGEREEFIGEAHEINGEEKTVAEMTSRELEQLVKEVEAERAEKEKLQAQLALFETKAQQEKDDALDAAYKESEDRLERLLTQKEAAEKAQKEAEEKIRTMETELDELRMQADQTVLPDESELEKIRKEAEAAAREKAEATMQKKLDKAERDALKAKKAAAEARAAIEAHEAAQKDAEEAMVKAREELAQVKADTEKKLKAAGSNGITRFKVYFEGVQQQINKMTACIAEVEESEGAEEAEKLRKALKALCQSVEAAL